MFKLFLLIGAALNVAVGLLPPIDVYSGFCFAVATFCILLAVFLNLD